MSAPITEYQGVPDTAPIELQHVYYSFCGTSCHVSNLKALVACDTEHAASFFGRQLFEEEARLRAKVLAACRELNGCLTRQYNLASAVLGEEQE